MRTGQFASTLVAMRFSLPAAVVATVAALTFATGCASEAPPVVIETPTPTATNTEPTASPTPTTPSPSPSPSGDGLSAQELWDILPEGADIPDIRGATITARYFLQLHGSVYAGDMRAIEIWETLTTENCDFCQSVVEQGRQLADSGEMFVGGGVNLSERPVEAFLADDDPETAYVMEIFITDPHQILDSGGEVVREGSSEEVMLIMRLSLVDSLWLVDGVDRDQEAAE